MYTPIQMPRAKKYGNNYWEMVSYKLKRTVQFFSDLEYEHCILVETNPEVETYCEQPLNIRYFYENEWVESIFDMWIKYKNGEETFVEVKYSSELNITTAKNERSIRQTTIQRLWCEENNYHYKVVTEEEIRNNRTYLYNMIHLLSSMRTMYHSIDTATKSKVLSFFTSSPTKIDLIIKQLHDIPPYKILSIINSCIYYGEVQANVDLVPLGTQTEVWSLD